MLEVFVFHGLAQERQGATGFPAAVPNLSTESPVRWPGTGWAQGLQLQPSPAPCHYLDGNGETILPEGLEEEGAGLSGLLDRHQVP